MAKNDGADFIARNVIDRRDGDTELTHFYDKAGVYSHSAYLTPSDSDIRGRNFKDFSIGGPWSYARYDKAVPSHIAYSFSVSGGDDRQVASRDAVREARKQRIEYYKAQGTLPQQFGTTINLVTDLQGNRLEGKK